MLVMKGIKTERKKFLGKVYIGENKNPGKR